jgi:hypothetical protein
MAAEVRVDVHHGAPCCLLGLFAAAAGVLADWSEFDAEAERFSIEVCGLPRRPEGADRELYARSPYYGAPQAAPGS